MIQKIFGSKNDRELKKLHPIIVQIASLESAMKEKTDDQLRAMTATFKTRLDNGASEDDLLPEVFATAREASVRVLGMRHFDMQLVGGIVLHQGKIAEMRTGEGKTLSATLPAYLNALSGKGVHVVTVNDYLATRDAEWMGKLYNFLGLSVGIVVHAGDNNDKHKNYLADITYGQNNEFGFDYLRDNMKMSPGDMAQRPLHYAIVDEVDSILIDEARTPLIISGQSEESADLYQQINRIIPRLKNEVDYTIDEKAHSSMLTDQGVTRIEKLLDLQNLYDSENILYVHHVSQSLRAHTLYKRDINYLIDNGKIVIIDEFTGRKMPGRRWSDGLHQAIEAKENVTIAAENQTLASVTFQNYFRMYDKLSGMTGTADTEATEFHQIYKLDVIVVPTNKPMVRQDNPDLIYKNESSKFKAVAQEIIDCNKQGQPVLVGTVSVEKSEVISHILRQHKIEHHVLNAKHHENEAGIVAQAGRKHAVTISTNMAGRGTDIVLGGNPEIMTDTELLEQTTPKKSRDELLKDFQEQCDKERKEVLEAGGLHIIGTERHESRRIDNQLRGRSGRQGDAGSSRFYLSLDDDLLRIFGAERITGLMHKLGMEEDIPIEHKWVTQAIERAQKKVEGSHFDTRKNLLEYDDVMNQQRKTLYLLRHNILLGKYHNEEEQAVNNTGSDEETNNNTDEPIQSIDWSHDTLVQEITEPVTAMVQAINSDQNIPEEFVPSEILRHELWKQTGAWVDTESVCTDPNTQIKPLISTIADSMQQQHERLCDLSEDIIEKLIDAYCSPNTPSDYWDLEAFEKELQELFNTNISFDKDLDDVQELATQAWNQIETRIHERKEELGRPFLLYFLRHFSLSQIDAQWIGHLRNMETLRQGIGLRGYGQKDPKKEYKKEGFNFFGTMMTQIETNLAHNLFHVQRQTDQQASNDIPEMKQKEQRITETHAGTKTTTKPQDKKTIRRDQPKLGRNEPCHCGSGIKFKKCHGKTV